MVHSSASWVLAPTFARVPLCAGLSPLQFMWKSALPRYAFRRVGRKAKQKLIRMIESGTVGQKLYRRVIPTLCGVLLCSGAWAQSGDAPVPLGDVARSLRKQKDQAQQQSPQPPQATVAPLPARTVIDNDNFSQVLDQAEALHITHGNFLYTFDQAGRTFQVSSPDVTCSLSFNSRAASLLSRPIVQMDLPEEEVRKLDGPAAISDQGLQVAVFNGTQWQVEEITVGVTIVRRSNPMAGYYGTGKLRPAAAETPLISEKQADTTTLYHLKASALPSATTVFKAPLTSTPASDQEWHWAIVQARGIPPKPENSALKAPLQPSNNAVIP